MNLTEKLKSKFSDSIQKTGESYANQDRVDFMSISEESASALVDADESEYFVDLTWTDNFSSIRYSCTCPQYYDGVPCKHIWATVLKVDAIQGASQPLKEMGIDVSQLFDAISEGYDIEDLAQNAERLLPKKKTWKNKLWEIRDRQQNKQQQSQRTPKAKAIRAWFVLTLSETVETSEFTLQIYSRSKKKNGEYGKAKQVPMGYRGFSHFSQSEDREILEFLSNYNSYSGYYGRWDDRNTVAVPESMLDFLLPKLCQTNCFAWRLERSVPVEEAGLLSWDAVHPFKFELQIDEMAENECWNITSLLRRGDELLKPTDSVFVSGAGWLFLQNRICRIEAPETAYPWISQINASGVQVPFSDRVDFLKEFAAVAPPDITNLPPNLKVKQVQPDPSGHFSFLGLQQGSEASRNAQNMARVNFDYGEVSFGIHETTNSKFDSKNEQFVQRNQEAEKVLRNQLPSSALVPLDIAQSDADFTIKLTDTIGVINLLLEKGWTVDSQGTRFKQAGDFKIDVTSDVDWFDVNATINFDGTQVRLPELLKAAKRGERFIRLGDGTNGVLPEKWLQQQQRLLNLAEVDGDSVRFRQSQALLLDVMLAEQENVTLDRSFNDYRKKLKELNGIQPGSEPPGFVGELRPYQRDGIGWFSFLQDFRFGGCLADDMGLGKTVQVLALLQQRKIRKPAKHEPQLPSIVVVPKSLIFNWIDEAKRFCSELRVVNYTGLERASVLDSAGPYDVLITTYGTLRRDVVKLKDLPFDYVILDEAQAIKNHQSQAAKACRLLNGKHRLAMSGTPIENHLGELWSLFEFLNPGMLGSSAAFQLLSKDAKKGDDQSLKMLSKALQPFILRRTKDQVLKDLPEKTEQTLYCELDTKQRKGYDELRNYYRAHLNKEIKKNGLQKSKFHVLEALLRLRQAACHPGLIDAAKASDISAKQEVLIQQIEDVLSEGHKALVFSQFTSLLSIIRKPFDKKKIPYAYLDGKTRKRAEAVKRFQEDPDCKLFLISLKAGGHGLNLTAADYVFILDPWWNPAAEAQAIDRAHRIGQTRPVFAYRLICRDTVEEKIVQLQQEKRDLADAIIGASKSVMRTLSADDLQLLLS